MITTKSMRLDVTKRYTEPINLVQYEVDARVLDIRLSAGGLPVNVSGGSVVFYAQKPDGTILYNACTIVNGAVGHVTYTVTEQTCAVAGELRCWVLVIKDDAELRSLEFNVIVQPSEDDTEAIESTSEFTALEEALALVSDHEARIDTAEGDISAAQDNITELQEAMDVVPVNIYYEKNVHFVGSSTVNSHLTSAPTIADPRWTDTFAELTGATVTYDGIGGATVALLGTMSPEQQAKAYSDRIEGQDYSGIDYLFMIFGGNDYSQNVPMGNDYTTNVKDTFKGALHFCLKHLRTEYPTLNVIMVTTNYAPAQLVRNSVGHTYEDYLDAIKQIAGLYSAPVIDANHEMGVTADNMGTLYGDGVHFTQTMYDKYALYLSRKQPGSMVKYYRKWFMPTYADGATEDSTPVVGVYKDAEGFVHFLGRIRRTTAGELFTLPVEYRPAYACTMPVLSKDGSTMYHIGISTAGVVSTVDMANTVKMESVPSYYAGGGVPDYYA